MDFMKVTDFKFRRNGIPKISPKRICRKILYPDNFWYHFITPPDAYYQDYEFLQNDPDLKLFHVDGLPEDIPETSMY